MAYTCHLDLIFIDHTYSGWFLLNTCSQTKTIHGREVKSIDLCKHAAWPVPEVGSLSVDIDLPELVFEVGLASLLEITE